MAEFAATYRINKENNKNYESDDDNGTDEDKNGDDIDTEEEYTAKQKSKKFWLILYWNYKLFQDEYNYYQKQILLYVLWREERNEIENCNIDEKFNTNSSIINQNKLKFVTLDVEIIEEALQKVENYNDENVNEINKFNKPICQNFEVDSFKQSNKEHHLFNCIRRKNNVRISRWIQF